MVFSGGVAQHRVRCDAHGSDHGVHSMHRDIVVRGTDVLHGLHFTWVKVIFYMELLSASSTAGK